MLSLPEEHELIGLFESEPELLDGNDKPWTYNELKFKYNRGEEEVVVYIYPSFGELRIIWSQQEETRLNIKLIDLSSLIVQMQHNDEFMAASGQWNDYSVLVKLRLKPMVAIEFEQNRVE